MIFSCKEGNNSISSISQDYLGDKFYLNELEICDSAALKKMKFYVTHKNLDSNVLKNYDLIIRVDNSVIIEPYKEEIIKDNFEICKNELSIIYIGLIDREKNISYHWNKKESYDLNNVDNIYIRLFDRNISEGSNYKLKFNKNLFYK